MTEPIIVRRHPYAPFWWAWSYGEQANVGAYKSPDVAIAEARRLMRFNRPAVISAPVLVYTSPIPE